MEYLIMNAFRTTGITVFLLIIFSMGCGRSEQSRKNIKPAVTFEDSSTVKFHDENNRRFTVKKNPKRAVFLFNSLLDLWYFTGGTAEARVTGDISVPPGARNIETIGSVGNPNLERITALNPDLVVLYKGMRNHRKLLSFFKQSKIPYIILRYQHYEDFLFISDLFFRVNGNNGGLSKIKKIDNEIKNIINKCPDTDNPLVMIAFATSGSISSELPSGDTGRMLKMLKARNVAEKSPVEGATRVDISLERITSLNPDIMLVKTMGDPEKAKARMTPFLKSNNALEGINAVKNGRIYYLPREYFMYKPNSRYPEAFRFLASILYPSVFDRKTETAE